MNFNNIKITGSWGGEPIWRYKTPEEKLQDAGIKSEEAMIYLALLANKDNKNYGNSNNKVRLYEV